MLLCKGYDLKLKLFFEKAFQNNSVEILIFCGNKKILMAL